MERLDGGSKQLPDSAQHSGSAGAGASIEAARFAQLKANISNRLRRVCAHLTDEQFDELVRDVAEVTLRYEERAYGLTVRDLRRAD